MSKFKLKESVDRNIYKAFNVISNLIFFFKNKERRLVGENIKYKDIHKGHKVFVIGNGPSIKALDQNHFDYLGQNITFAVNFFYKNDRFPLFQPTYYALVDPITYTPEYKEMYNEVKRIYKDSILITDYRAKKLVEELKFKHQSIFLYSKKYPVDYIDCDISINSFITMNVVSTCILNAIYMGAKEIYLVGTDYNSFASRNEVHFYDEDEDDDNRMVNRLGYQLKYYHITTEFHYLIAALARKKKC